MRIGYPAYARNERVVAGDAVLVSGRAFAESPDRLRGGPDASGRCLWACLRDGRPAKAHSGMQAQTPQTTRKVAAPGLLLTDRREADRSESTASQRSDWASVLALIVVACVLALIVLDLALIVVIFGLVAF